MSGSFDLSQTNNTTSQACTLIGGSFDKFIQILLGIIALSVLIIKRHREIPQRPIKIWMLDSSKQLFGAGVAHLANLSIAIMLRKAESPDQSADECAFYFINFFIDTSIGVLVNWSLMTLLRFTAEKYKWESLTISGYYGSPISYKIWIIQLFSWIAIILVTKLLLGIFIYGMEQPFAACAEWLFQPLASYPKAELVIVMIACPCAMNAMQFWIQDNFLKKSPTGSKVQTNSPKPLTGNESSSSDSENSPTGLEMKSLDLV